MQNNLIVVLGPTACGKTTFAAHLAYKIDGEIISGDSRQVYRDMTIGTGKDLADYIVDGKQIPYHLVDICEAGEKYNVYRFQNDFQEAFLDITSRGKTPILCGGTGLYIEAVLKNYRHTSVPPDKELRASLESKSLEELTEILAQYKSLHNTTDTDTKTRAIRSIEIEKFYAENPIDESEMLDLKPLVIGLDIERDLRREKITRRLNARFEEGMVEEVQKLLDRGISAEDLIYYGLEYKYLTLYATGNMTFDQMKAELEIAIHQFAKRQMTWFRGMERRGTHIEWIDAALPMEEKLDKVLALMA
ncbi:MAG: tRNA (adenosine(37)-N6)-dimethylallyltransferase MiaA [Bacteroidales bacterium]|nr:tRNA (adenosine(37)-N6)-dimethylallyltransferase MiaA [Bacteroidales bacterium]